MVIESSSVSHLSSDIWKSISGTMPPLAFSANNDAFENLSKTPIYTMDLREHGRSHLETLKSSWVELRSESRKSNRVLEVQ